MVVCEQVSKAFGGVQAVWEVDMQLPKGEVTGIIGGNGAGKTTLFNIMTGFERADKGKVYLQEGARRVNLLHKGANQLAQLGFVRTFQHIRLFPQFTVKENIFAGAVACGAGSQEVERWMNRLHLQKVKDRAVGALPYGTKRLVELARALSTGAQYLFLDEIGAGMSEEELDALANTLLHVQQRDGITMVLIEHNMAFMQKMCKNLYAMDNGKVLAKGKTDQVLCHPLVREYITGE